MRQHDDPELRAPVAAEVAHPLDGGADRREGVGERALPDTGSVPVRPAHRGDAEILGVAPRGRKPRRGDRVHRESVEKYALAELDAESSGETHPFRDRPLDAHSLHGDVVVRNQGVPEVVPDVEEEQDEIGLEPEPPRLEPARLLDRAPSADAGLHDLDALEPRRR